MSALSHAGRAIRFVWERSPEQVRTLKPVRACGALIHRHVSRSTTLGQSHCTWFMRNVPQLEVLREQIGGGKAGSTVRVLSVGCSTGAELYSCLFVLRKAHPDLHIVGRGVDLSRGAVEAARAGLFHPDRSAAEGIGTFEAGESELKGLPPGLTEMLFEEEDGSFRVRDWIRTDTTWVVGDASDPRLADHLGGWDLVMANNFLGPMPDEDAERCLRSIVKLVKPGGYLALDGVNLNLKTRVMASLDLAPVCGRLEEIHHADRSKGGWPWTRWSHEPVDRSRRDWRTRYATIYRSTAGRGGAVEASAGPAVTPGGIV